MSETITGWHFAAADRRLANGDGREIVVGETLSVKGTLRACQNALHMSPLALTALQYAAGPLACRVELRGSPREKSDTPGVWYGRSRKCLAMADATEALGLFVVDTLIYRQPHLVTVFERAGFPTHAEAIRGLMIPIETLADAERVFEAAGAAAEDAARAAAWAAGAAARAAAWAAGAAAEDAVWAAAGAAAGAAAWAAGAAAGDAARDALNDLLTAQLDAALAKATGN